MVCVNPFWCVEPVVVVTCENDRAIVRADDGLVVQAVGEADARSESAEPGIGQRTAALPPFAGTCVNQRAGTIVGARIRAWSERSRSSDPVLPPAAAWFPIAGRG